MDEPDPKEPHEPLLTQPVSVVRERGASLLHDAWFNKVSKDDADVCNVKCILCPCMPVPTAESRFKGPVAPTNHMDVHVTCRAQLSQWRSAIVWASEDWCPPAH